MRNADWITVENRSEAWYKFKDWCRSKYGNSFADAYTAFMWMIDPEYYIMPEDREINPGISSIQKMCMEKMTDEVFKTNIDLYRFASKILDTIAHFEGRLSQKEIFNTIVGIAEDVIKDHYRNSQLICLAGDVRQIAYNWKNGLSK